MDSESLGENLANWTTSYDFTPFYHNDNFSVKEKGRKIVDLIKIDEDDYEIEDILELIKDATDEVEFDEAMENLYFWADCNLVWIKTI